MPPDLTSKFEAAARATDLDDLLHHIAWEETLRPAIQTYRATYQNLLVQSVLGQVVQDRNTGNTISKEVLAGRIDAIDWLERYLTSVMRKGSNANEFLRSEQLYLNNNNK